MAQLFRCVQRRKYETFVIIGCVKIALLLMWILLRDSEQDASTKSASFSDPTCMAIDVVYTWVNGSDPAFMTDVRRYDINYDTARYDDKNELLYSLRSLERYAPWVRHVYIVTNGQIPHWLDLSYEKVTVIPHTALAPLPSKQLPTFSSAAIETFLHRIPGLSQHFLYMNDDIFLGEPLYPDDLYSQSEGVRIYQAAWLIPECADDCPWTYIGDGVCDNHCNIAACQHDGGDCDHESEDKTIPQPTIPAVRNAAARIVSTENVEQKLPSIQMKRGSFKELITRQQNSTTLHMLRQIVDAFNKRLQQKQTRANMANHTQQSNVKKSRRKFRTTSLRQTKAQLSTIKSKLESNPSYKSTKDVYSQSLIYTNMLLNHHYGFKSRNVLAHVGFLLQRDIMEAMQAKFAAEIAATARQLFRSPHDLQLAFAYYNFVMAETRSANVAEIFDELDTDGSGTWSDSEVRTFLARMFPLPLDWSALHFFQEVIHNCTRHLNDDRRSAYLRAVTSAYERYEDSNLPKISRELVTHCEPLAEALHTNFALRPRYKYNIVPKRSKTNNFMMLTSNVTEVVEALDRLRRKPRKFNCINDNMEPEPNEENVLIRQLLEDFYRSFFPHRSKFELQTKYRNRFKYMHKYKSWLRRKRIILLIGYCASLILLIFLLRLLCAHKAKFVRRYIQKL